MSNLVGAIQGVLEYLRAVGPLGVVERELRRARDRRGYRGWLRRTERAAGAPAVDPAGPLLSVLMPTFESDPHWLSLAIGSVRAQTYPNWELCIADDASTRPELMERLAAFAREDPRIRVMRRNRRGHISASSNSALAMARGAFVALLDHDDELAPDALGWIAQALRAHPDADVVYSDEDKIDEHGRRNYPYFKPDFSPDLLLSQNLITHLGVYRTEVLRRIGGFREGFEGAQDHDLVLRVLEVSAPSRVRHVPRVLYHWRTTAQSTSAGLWRKDYAHVAGCRAIADHLARTGARAVVERSLYSYYRVRYELPATLPAVTVVAIEPVAPAFARGVDAMCGGVPVELVRVARGPAAGFAERCNAAVRDCRGSVVVFLGADCTPTPGWLEELVAQALRPEIGVVGGRVLARSGRVLHAGYLLCLDRETPVLDAFRGLPAKAPGHFGRANLVQNLSAVGLEVLAVRREVFDAQAGFAAADFPDGLFDVDFCLRVGRSGRRVLFTPHATVRGRRVSARDALRLGSPAGRARLRELWASELPRDPHWHPALDRRFGDHRIDGSARSDDRDSPGRV